MAERVLMKGNEALAEAALRAGCRHFFGYPITPQTELSAYMSKRMPKVGGVFLQAESEVAAINMVLGASAAGVRVMTSSSSPGISLKTEGISYIAGSDLPCVIVNVQRGGPGLGGIQPSQADYNQATKAPGHGDLHIMVFAPCTVQEMVDTVSLAFRLSDTYRCPAMILIDGLLGQMMEPITFEERDEAPIEKPWALTGGTDKRKHNVVNSLHIEASVLEGKVRERFERYRAIEDKEVRVECDYTDDAEYLVVAYGATARIAKTAVRAARKEGIRVGLLRPVTLWPFPKKEIAALAGKVKGILAVEMSMGQMVDDVRLSSNGRCPVHFFGRTGGIVPTTGEVQAEIQKMKGGAV